MYHGGFEHPVRAFVIGSTLLVLLFGGFVVGVEAGTHPMDSTRANLRLVTTKVVRVPTPVVRTVIRGSTRVERLAGATRTQVVVIYEHGKKIYAYETPTTGSTVSGSPVTDSAPTYYTVAADTVTVPVTVPPVTVTDTVTVTAPSSSVDTQPTSSSTGP
jgi:hypothetical protein